MNSDLEMQALENIIAAGGALIREAMSKTADIKQGRLASEAMGRVNAATKTRLEYRLNGLRLIEIEAKLIEAERSKPAPQAVEGPSEAA